MVKISTCNSKLGLIPSINLPPIITCRTNCPCATKCYALKGRFRFKNVRSTMEENFQRYSCDPDGYFEDIMDFLTDALIGWRYFRWHSTGDIVDPRYFAGMVKIARSLPFTSFLAFTKQYEIVNDFLNNDSLPENLNIIFSAWDNTLLLENPHNLPVAYVKLKDGSNIPIPDNAIKCSGACSKCLTCWNIKSGESVYFNEH